MWHGLKQDVCAAHPSHGKAVAAFVKIQSHRDRSLKQYHTCLIVVLSLVLPMPKQIDRSDAKHADLGDGGVQSQMLNKHASLLRAPTRCG